MKCTVGDNIDIKHQNPLNSGEKYKNNQKAYKTNTVDHNSNLNEE